MSSQRMCVGRPECQDGICRSRVRVNTLIGELHRMVKDNPTPEGVADSASVIGKMLDAAYTQAENVGCPFVKRS